jgi:serine/threonine protein kinase/tetratricopeptide (TPR) repeat protein
MAYRLSSGDEIAHYRVIEPVGSGGMSEVYLAEDQKLNRNVALKLLHHQYNVKDPAAPDFRHEARAAASLNHPNIITIYDIFDYSGYPIIAMEYIEGNLLSDLIDEKGLPQDHCLSISIELCRALSAAHNNGIVHRDIKPDNIMVTPDGSVKIMDFGLALYKEKTPTAITDSISGTYAYMSPEQARGEAIDYRSDLFSMGVVLYEMITGRIPFEGELLAAVTYSIINENPPPVKSLRDDVSDEFQRIISKAMEKNRLARYQNIEEMLQDLNWLKNSLEKEVPEKYYEQARSIPSIGVLPFRDMSPEKDQDYFGEGIAEDIISNLTKIKGLHVVARTSSFSFRESRDDIKEIGRKLGVGTILEGSIRKIEDRIRVTVQLIDVENGYHLWSERYDRVMKDMFEIQDEISLSITDRLEVNIGDDMSAAPTKHQTENPDAYCLYLKGRFFWNIRTGESLKKAIEFFEKALEIDDNYALAYAGLSDVYRALPDYASYSPREAYEKARELANKAIEIDNSLSEAHTSLAVILNNMFDWEGAEKEFRKAIESNPGYATAHHWFALYYMYQARFAEAIEEINKAYSLDPLSLPINRDIGTVYYYAGRYDEAIEALRKTLELDPNFSLVHELLGRAFLKKGMYEEALREFETEKGFARSWRPVLDAWIIITYMETGMKDKAEKLLDDLKRKSEETYISPYSLSWIYFALGDEEQGFQWLEKAYKERDNWLCEIKVEPVFDKVRQDPRFLTLLKNLGLD